MCTLLHEYRLGIKKDMVNIFTCFVRKPARNSVTLSFKPPDSPPWVRPQLEYASAVWPPTLPLLYRKWKPSKGGLPGGCIEIIVTLPASPLKDLNWHPLDQRRKDSRLIMLYKVTYDLVAIPAPQYLARNTRLSRHIHPLSYRQIPTLKDYYRFTFFPRSIIHWNALPAHIPVLPTLAQFSSAGCQKIHVSP